MPTPVRWKQGPWATMGLTQSSPATPSAAPSVSATATPYSQLSSGQPFDAEGGGSWASLSEREPAGYGRAPALEALSDWGSRANTVATLAGMSNPVLGAIMAGMMPMSMASKYLAGPSYDDPMAGVPTQRAIDEARALGQVGAADMQHERDVARAGMDPTLDIGPPTPRGYEEAPELYGGVPGGFGDGSGGPSGSGDQEAGGPEGSDTSGPGTGGTGGGTYAKGGVVKTKGPYRALLGDNPSGKETGIFVPKEMERPGRQANEAHVMQALLQTLERLGGRGAGKPTGTTPRSR